MRLSKMRVEVIEQQTLTDNVRAIAGRLHEAITSAVP
jgi:hypothetical protein